MLFLNKYQDYWYLYNKNNDNNHKIKKYFWLTINNICFSLPCTKTKKIFIIYMLKFVELEQNPHLVPYCFCTTVFNFTHYPYTKWTDSDRELGQWSFVLYPIFNLRCLLYNTCTYLDVSNLLWFNSNNTKYSKYQ